MSTIKSIFIIIIILVILGFAWISGLLDTIIYIIKLRKKYENMSEEKLKICYDYLIYCEKTYRMRNKRNRSKEEVIKEISLSMLYQQKLPKQLKRRFDEPDSKDYYDIKYLEKKLNLKGKK